MLIPHGFEANYTVGFARGLAANGIRFTVVSDDDTAPRFDAAGIRHVNLRRSLDPRRKSWRKLANLARYYAALLWTVLRHRGASIHFNGLLTSRIIMIDGIVLPLWLRIWAGRYIHTAHNALPHGREDSALFRAAYRWIYRFPHTIVAHTERTARQLETDFGVDRARIEVVSIGLNEEVPDCALPVGEARRALALPVDAPLALFFGKVQPYKGVDLLAEAWRKVRTPGARLVIVGECEDRRHAARIRGLLDGSGHAETAEWREGFVPNAEVALWLRACDVVVMPYRNIYQSGVVFLCLRFGVPIIATPVGSLAEYIDADSGIIADTNDSAGIAAAIDRFFATRDGFRRDEIARRASRFAWRNQCRSIVPLYK